MGRRRSGGARFCPLSRSAKTAATPSPSPAQVAASPTIPASPVVTVHPSPIPIPPPVIPTPSAPESTATVEPKASATSTPQNQKAPSPRNNRAWQVWIDDFVHNFIASNETNDVDLAVSFYAPNVDLFEGKSIDGIRRTSVIQCAGRRVARPFVATCGREKPNRITPRASARYYWRTQPREWINGAVAVDLQHHHQRRDTKIVSGSKRPAKGRGTGSAAPSRQSASRNPVETRRTCLAALPVTSPAFPKPARDKRLVGNSARCGRGICGRAALKKFGAVRSFAALSVLPHQFTGRRFAADVAEHNPRCFARRARRSTSRSAGMS